MYVPPSTWPRAVGSARWLLQRGGQVICQSPQSCIAGLFAEGFSPALFLFDVLHSSVAEPSAILTRQDRISIGCHDDVA
jgi:hypothetical protein